MDFNEDRKTYLVGGLALVLIGAVVAALVAFGSATGYRPQLTPYGFGKPGFLSAYDSTHTSPPRPDQPKTGLWLEIPSLQISVPIEPGDGSNHIPYWTALEYPGTAVPGTPGNSYLYGHGTWGTFGALIEAHPGEQVLIRDYASTTQITLHVTRVVGRIRWNDMSWIHVTSSVPLVTLQTCIDANPTGDRWIVQAS